MSDLGTPPEANSSFIYSTDRVSQAQFLRLSRWFTLALCLTAIILPLPFGRQGVWLALRPAGLFTWKTAISGIMGLAIGALVVVLSTHWHPLRTTFRRLVNLVAWETFRPLDFAATALMAALGEELLFRGALQPLIGLAPTVVIFGLLHATSVTHVLIAGLLGLLLGWLYQWSGSLWPPIVAHLVIDLVTGLFLSRTLRSDVAFTRGD